MQCCAKPSNLPSGVATGVACSEAARAALTPVRAMRVGDALRVELPALPGGSAFVLLDLALRSHGLPEGQLVAGGAAPRLRIELPLASTAR